MRFTEIFSDQLDHGYAVLRLNAQGRDFILIASEEDQPAYAYDLDDDFARTTVWPAVGGTMTMVQLPGSLDFLATQRFYPGFNSAACRIVHAHFNGQGWDLSVVADFPYLHRFDIIPHQGGYWFVGCTIANSKQFTEDWSDPGKVFVGDYDQASDSLTGLRELPTRITKNHGYRRGEGNFSYITGQQGIFRLDYPTAGSDWQLTQLTEEETSDLASVDINSDGQPEYLAIQGFHGPSLCLYDHDFAVLARSDSPTPFGHAIDGVELLGRPCFLFGYRSGAQELLTVGLGPDGLTSRLIEAGVGPSNVLVYQKDGQTYLLSAQREANQVAVYLVSQD